jgi:raffinose/stachyose/melibiose transport system permease protein
LDKAGANRKGGAKQGRLKGRITPTSWNSYLLPLVVLKSESRYPWTLGLMAYQGQYTTSWQLVLAFITLTILPAILIFLLAQRYIVAGLTAGAVKA